MEKYLNLRKDYPVFKYKSYKITETSKTVEVQFSFEITGLMEFNPTWSFPKSEAIKISDDIAFEKIVFSLGMAEAVSYWKATCSPQINVECGYLSDEQIKWWKKLYFFGLGEFFYINDIKTDIESFVNITSNNHIKFDETPCIDKLSGCLVPIGGGKDSALTLETLTQNGFDCKCFAINNRNSIISTVTTAGLEESDLLTAKRGFDRSLVELNKKGFLNGHTPFSSIVAFSAEATAYLHKLQFIVLSNESSANESTVAGMNVNHQYSKSFEFENDFHEYEKKYLRTGIEYFSFLRPLTEFQIAKMFVHHKKYLTIFRSCNLGSKFSPDIWCSECPKCLFVALILAPFIDAGQLTEIFGENLLNNVDMLQFFIELIGKSEHKPFECVGSIDEVNLAVNLAISNYKQNKTELPLLFQEYIKLGLYMPDEAYQKEKIYCRKFNNQHLLPEKFENILKKEMERIL